MLLLFFIILAAYCTAVTQNNTRVHWLYIHYHKTGHDLAIHFGNDVFKDASQCNVKAIRISEPKVDNLTRNDIIVLARGEYTWRGTFFQDHHHFKIVHFARDPYDMILSGFLYHSQTPPPKNEDWLTDATFSPCKHNREVIKKYYLTYLLDFVEHSYDLTTAVNNVYSLCHLLTSKYKVKKYSEKLKLMKRINIYDGIRIEATRAIADILLMGANAHQENLIALNGSNPYMSSRRVYTSLFPVQQKDTYRSSTESLFNFLLSDSDIFNYPFYGCMTKTEIVDAAMKASYSNLVLSEKSNDVEMGVNKHITSGLMSNEDRQALIQRLKDDEVLSPILEIVTAVLFERTFNESLRQRLAARNPSEVKIKVGLPQTMRNSSHIPANGKGVQSKTKPSGSGTSKTTTNKNVPSVRDEGAPKSIALTDKGPKVAKQATPKKKTRWWW